MNAESQRLQDARDGKELNPGSYSQAGGGFSGGRVGGGPRPVMANLAGLRNGVGHGSHACQNGLMGGEVHAPRMPSSSPQAAALPAVFGAAASADDALINWPTADCAFIPAIKRRLNAEGLRLKTRVTPPVRFQTLALQFLPLTVLALFAAGCATSDSGSRPARPGAGLAEYRQLVVDLRQAVIAMRQSADALTSAPESKSAAAYARFDDAAQRLEVVSLKVRARADAMEKRGEAYFQEWEEEIQSETGRAKERFAELRQHFNEILKGSRQVRQAFRPFLDGLRAVALSLGSHPAPAAIEKARPTLTKVVSDGKQAEETMDQLLNTLSAAQTAVESGPMPPPRSERKP